MANAGNSSAVVGACFRERSLAPRGRGLLGASLAVIHLQFASAAVLISTSISNVTSILDEVKTPGAICWRRLGLAEADM